MFILWIRLNPDAAALVLVLVLVLEGPDEPGAGL